MLASLFVQRLSLTILNYLVVDTRLLLSYVIRLMCWKLKLASGRDKLE